MEPAVEPGLELGLGPDKNRRSPPPSVCLVRLISAYRLRASLSAPAIDTAGLGGAGAGNWMKNGTLNRRRRPALLAPRSSGSSNNKNRY